MPHSVRHPRRLAAILALALLPAGTVAAISTAREPAEGKVCEIRATPQAGMVRLEAFAGATRLPAGPTPFTSKNQEVADVRSSIRAATLMPPPDVRNC